MEKRDKQWVEALTGSLAKQPNWARELASQDPIKYTKSFLQARMDDVKSKERKKYQKELKKATPTKNRFGENSKKRFVRKT